ncbi:MAG: hypothetical protein LUQ32_09705 [Methanomicrobiales archaeon]|nr:hypothetical protein [Methanomicrobiales archaeon]
MRQTCPKSEYLLIDPKIYSFAQSILDQSEIEEAEELSLSLASSKAKRDYAIKKLRTKVGVTPKRPLYYVSDLHLRMLPRWTRDSVKYMGDFVDQLVKYLASEILANPKYLTRSLGINLKHLKNKVPEPLYSNLVKYNDWIYVPAKHELSVENRKHLFTTKEVVFICFISLKFKEEIIKISKDAKNYSEGRRGYIAKGGYECES